MKRTARLTRLYAVTLYGICALAVVFGIMLAVVSLRQAPGDDAAAHVFRTDPSCGPNLSAPPLRGACRVVPMVVEEVSVYDVGSVRTRSREYVVRLRFASGRRVSGHLSRADGQAFVENVHPGTAGRAQFFRSTLVRVAAAGSSAETVSAPNLRASGDAVQRWVAAAMIAFGLVFGFAGSRRL